RRERARLVALVGVHARRVEVSELARHGHLAGQPLAEERRPRAAVAPGASGGGEERLLARAVPERAVQVERRAGGAHVVFRHEGERAMLEVRDLLGPVLVERGAVRHLERLGVDEVDLLLAAAPLALGRLHRHVGRLHPVADGADERLLLRRLQDVIVLEIVRHRRQVLVTFRPRLLERLAEAVELELGRRLHEVALRGRAGDLALEHPARRLLDRRAVVVVHVAEHERRLRQPRDHAQGGEVGDHLHVAVAALPRGEREARLRLHLHVHRQEVDARVDAVGKDVVDNADGRGDFWWGAAVSTAMVIGALTSPPLGGIADHAGARWNFFVGFSVVSIAATALMATVGPGRVWWGWVLAVVGIVTYEAAFVYYNSYLPRIAPPERIGRVSAAGFAVGYAGSLVAFAA